MKTFQVSLAKTYTVNIFAENEIEAKEFAEIYTGDIQDISTESQRRAENFRIQQIECQSNDAIDCVEIADE